MYNNPMQIHETVLRDIVDLISGVSKEMNNDGPFFRGTMSNASYRSAAKAASNLTLVFPVVAEESVSIDIAPAEQTAEVQAQLAAITPSEIAPESIKVLDPAVGSGHILVEAYRVLKAIYTERGYRTRDIPQLILQHNLFGLDIDDRAGQLAGFALMMLAREDDRRIFERDIRLNVLALQESSHVDLPTLWRDLGSGKAWQSEKFR